MTSNMAELEEMASTSKTISPDTHTESTETSNAAPTSCQDPQIFSVNRADIKTVSEEEQAEELRGLGISVYDQTEFESSIIAQVSEHIKIQDNEIKKKMAIKEQETALDDVRLVKQRLKQIEKTLTFVPKESEMNKQAKNYLISIKQERENKMKQLKKLEAKLRMLQVQIDDGEMSKLENIVVEDGELDDEMKAEMEMMFGTKETEKEKLIKLGKMTPFGTMISENRQPKIITDSSELTEFEKYLLDQSTMQEKKKENQKKLKGKGKNLRKVASDDKMKALKIPSNIKSRTVEPIKRKNSSPKVNLDSDVTVKRTKIHLTTHKTEQSENRTKFQDEDCDWVPDSDEDCDVQFDDLDYELKKSKLSRHVRSKKNRYEEFTSDDENNKTKIKKFSKDRTVDDGDQDTYIHRLREYHKMKLIESRQKTSNVDKSSNNEDDEAFEEFGGGFRIILQIWNRLYDYQKTGVRWLWELQLQNCGGILGDEMGLGKTIQIIAFLVGLDYSDLLTSEDRFRGLGPTLIVCPTTLMHQWVREFHTWWPPFRVAVLHDTGSHCGTKESLVRNVYKDNGVIITSYNGVVKHQDLLIPRDWHYVILDEGHKIRNPDAQVTIVCKQLKTPHRLLLSGSPVQNNLKELWSIFDFIFPGKLGTLPVFMQQFSVPIVQGGYSNASQVQVQTAFKCATILRDTINPYLLRRMKIDVKMSLQLPNKSEQVLFCRLTQEQIDYYKQYLDSSEVHNILNGRLKVFMGLIALRKICNHPDLYSGGPDKMLVANNIEKDESNQEMEYGYFARSGKMLVIDSLLKLWKKQNHRVLLFSQSKQMLEIIEKFVKSNNYKYMRMDGGTSIASRQPAVNRFNNDSSYFVFLLTTRVGGLGLNLTGANRVIIFDPDWNPSTDIQARERAWRIGQRKHVTIYRLLTAGSIEEKIYHRQIFKQFLTNRILKDPRQRRFFKNNELHELFTLSEEGKQGTETGAIFAGTGSEIKVSPKAKAGRSTGSKITQEPPLDDEDIKRRKMKEMARKISQMIAKPCCTSNSKESQVRKNKKKKKKKSILMVEGCPIDNVAKQMICLPKDEEEQDMKQSLKQDDYVLQKLFAKSGVHSALKHDSIMESSDPDYVLVEGEAEKVAREAVRQLKESRRQCANAITGLPTWTGNRGIAGAPSRNKIKFGRKKNTKLLGNHTAEIKNSEDVKKCKVKKEAVPSTSSADTKMFMGQNMDQNDNQSPSSTSILATILRRSKTVLKRDESSDNSEDELNEAPVVRMSLQPEHDELLVDIRNYVAFQAAVDGQATTEELLSEFKQKLPANDAALFKAMLYQICTFHRQIDDNRGIWTLKPEFR